MLHHAGVYVCVQGAQHRGSVAYQARASPERPAALYSPAPEWLQGYTKAIHKTRDLNCPCYISTAQPTMGGNTAGRTTKCHSKLLKNKRHRKKLISITHVAVCKPSIVPGCAPTLSHSASCLCCCHSPSSIQVTVWSLIKLYVKVGLQPYIILFHPLQWEVGVWPHPHWACTCEAKKHRRLGATPGASQWALGTQPLDPPRPL